MAQGKFTEDAGKLPKNSGNVQVTLSLTDLIVSGGGGGHRLLRLGDSDRSHDGCCISTLVLGSL